MKLPPIRNQDEPPPKKNNYPILIASLGTIGFLAIIGLVILLPQVMPQLAALRATATPLVPTMSIPTPDCGSPTLVIGTTTFQIQNLAPSPDGSLPVPPDTSGIAYWVEGTNTNYVFVLSPASNNVALQTGLKTGDLATIYWADCTVTSFNVFAVEASKLNDPALLDQSKPGISVFVQTDSSTTGFVVKGKMAEETSSVIDTPKPDESGILAEVTLLDTSTSPDRTSIKIGISIRNYGQSAFTVSASNVSLTPQDAAPLAMTNSEPTLPIEIGTGATETIYFTFPRPSSQRATFKIFTVEYDIEDY